jgi:hypothetical protein
VETTAAQAILQSTYIVPAGTNEFTREFLQTIQASAPLNPQPHISCEITKEDYQQYWKNPGSALFLPFQAYIMDTTKPLPIVTT